MGDRITAALAGNPNSGKTTLITALTAAYVITGLTYQLGKLVF